MNRRRFLASAGAAGVAGLAGCPSESDSSTHSGTDRPSQTSPTIADKSGGGDDGRPPFRVGTDGFERLTEDGYEPLLVRGINLGMAKPGAFPGQAAITRAEYDRWLAAIGDIANVVRTYTIHPPAFYRALSAYNEDATDPLLLLQGTWVPTQDLLDAGDATAVSASVDRELRHTMDVLHGATELPERPGHASGTYDADVSDATLGVLFGIEWPPEVVAATNEADTVGAADGQYLTAEGASPFERWLATRLDRAIGHEAETYGTTRPAAFVNWVTTDPLEHPYEPFVDEDRVSIDPDAVAATDAFDAGTFAAYHAYPYYPDLLNETPSYVEYVDHRGEQNSYAGYLNDLAGATDHALLVAEFGVPSSRGIAHRHVHGRNQGRHTEQRQGEIVAAMYEDIRHAGTAGGVAFAWQNEWFKRTWNLDARSVPGRCPFWSNIETPEQRFGLLAFDPAESVTLDGSADDWTDATAVPATGDGATSVRRLERMDVAHDFEGLTVRLSFESTGSPLDWRETNALVTVGLTGQTTTLPQGVAATAPADFVVHLAGPDRSRLLVESSYDAFAREFADRAELDTAAYRSGQAGFVPVREPTNLGYTVPPTGERIPFEAVETGQLRFGNGNPDADAYDSLTDVYAAPDGSVLELRLPWVLLNVADPSTKQRVRTDWAAGLDVTGFDSLSVGAAAYAPATDHTARSLSGSTNLARAAPGMDSGALQTVSYGWEPWNDPAYEERLKESYHVLRSSDWDRTV
ncbi:MAG: hypothetical protein V5A45_10685 [Haloarculaceae archaeon]